MKRHAFLILFALFLAGISGRTQASHLWEVNAGGQRVLCHNEMDFFYNCAQSTRLGYFSGGARTFDGQTNFGFSYGGADGTCFGGNGLVSRVGKYLTTSGTLYRYPPDGGCSANPTAVGSFTAKAYDGDEYITNGCTVETNCNVEFVRNGVRGPIMWLRNVKLQPGDEIIVGPGANTYQLSFPYPTYPVTEAQLEIQANSRFTLDSAWDPANLSISHRLYYGIVGYALRAISPPPANHRVRIYNRQRTFSVGVRGTEFTMNATEQGGKSTMNVAVSGGTVDLMNQVGAQTPLTAGQSGMISANFAPHDFNKSSGTSDILWRDGSGNIALWLMNGTSASSVTWLGNVPSNWSIVGQRDFNDDGNVDLLWRNTSGDLVMWLMNGASASQVTGLGNVPTNWSVVSTADLNDDRKGDILWRDTLGNLMLWLMDGPSASEVVTLGNVGANWSVAGVADFNGDGKTDLLWRDTLGNLAMWLMDGATASQVVGLGNVAANWSVVGTADFNGDGKGDILWRDSSGNVAMWLMNGTTAAVAGLGNVGPSWSVSSNGDYNGDGKGDILWRSSTGDIALWLMNGATATSVTGLGNVTTNWAIQNANAN